MFRVLEFPVSESRRATAQVSAMAMFQEWASVLALPSRRAPLPVSEFQLSALPETRLEFPRLW